jgi:hypothetical protein
MEDKTMTDFETRFPEIAAEYAAVTDSITLGKVTRKWNKHADKDFSISFGAINHFKTEVKARIAASMGTQRSAADSRADQILHITNSNGKRTARKFN